MIRKIREAQLRHKLRRHPSGFSFLLADSIHHIDARAWEPTRSKPSIFTSREYLTALELAPPENLRPRYAVIFDKSVPVASVCAQIVQISGDRLGSKVSQKKGLLKIRDDLGRASLKGWKENVLICGNQFAWSQEGVSFAKNVEPARVWPAVAEALYRIRRADRLFGECDFVVIKDLPSDAFASSSILKDFSYRAMQTEPNMVLELPSGWKNYADYLQALQTKYRRNVTSIHSACDDAGIRLDRVRVTPKLADVLHSLYLQVHDNATFRPVTKHAQFLYELAQNLGDAFRCDVAFLKDKPIGFISSLKSDDTSVAYFIGFDREVAEDAPIYLKLLHRSIEQGLEFGAKRKSFGRTALEPKAALGAKPEPLHVWVRHRVQPLNVIVRQIVQGVPHANAPVRNPLKEKKVVV